MEADKRANDDFYEWLNNCPVQWFRINVDEDNLTYEFIISNKEGDID